MRGRREYYGKVKINLSLNNDTEVIEHNYRGFQVFLPEKASDFHFVCPFYISLSLGRTSKFIPPPWYKGG